ncbi:unnamed protein product [Spirodela intermedia]|uniref:Uncharacterized protein n=2 Tax=Spirodela intermedia TaxID=51605 RepID=A0A7I8IS30_SPIIN|nr:unnamed protein product [Spirodela intermedia]CAA6660565.1 unnamed protein product [Spirodela intermedia]CAA7396918.1 unnamed protein product [Spirodela intermedia]
MCSLLWSWVCSHPFDFIANFTIGCL